MEAGIRYLIYIAFFVFFSFREGAALSASINAIASSNNDTLKSVFSELQVQYSADVFQDRSLFLELEFFDQTMNDYGELQEEETTNKILLEYRNRKIFDVWFLPFSKEQNTQTSLADGAMSFVMMRDGKRSLVRNLNGKTSKNFHSNNFLSRALFENNDFIFMAKKNSAHKRSFVNILQSQKISYQSIFAFNKKTKKLIEVFNPKNIIDLTKNEKFKFSDIVCEKSGMKCYFLGEYPDILFEVDAEKNWQNAYNSKVRTFARSKLLDLAHDGKHLYALRKYNSVYQIGVITLSQEMKFETVFTSKTKPHRIHGNEHGLVWLEIHDEDYKVFNFQRETTEVRSIATIKKSQFGALTKIKSAYLR